MVDRIVNAGRVLTYIVGLFGVSWRKLMGEYGVTKASPTSHSHSFRAVQSWQAKILLRQLSLLFAET